MIARTIVLNAIEPAMLSIRQPLGVDLDLDLTFLKQDGAAVDPGTLKPQLALMPRSSWSMFAYEVATSNPEGGVATVSVPGSALTDPAGYTIELYQRRAAANPDDPAVPVGLLAKGTLRTEGSAYASWGPLSPINVPVVVGPPGEAGAPGQRGSIWTTGVGDPTATDALPGDMYLDNQTGNVWRWDGAAWMRQP